MKKGILVSLIAVALCVVLVGCNKAKDKNPIVGKWALGSFVYTFNADGTPVTFYHSKSLIIKYIGFHNT